MTKISEVERSRTKLAVVDASARQRSCTGEVGASAGTRQQNAAVPYRDTVGRDSLTIDER